MKSQWGRVVLVVCSSACAIAMATPALAQNSEVKEKPPLYSYVSSWAIPRAQWAEMEKADQGDFKIFEKALDSGAIVAYGHDLNLVHQPDQPTHDEWWSANSMAGILNVLEQFYQSGNTTTPVLSSATRHSDSIWVSHYYNWHSGSFKNAYTHVSEYKLKNDAPDDAVEVLSKNLVVPLLEKLLNDGALHEYEIDEQAIHTEAPGTFLIVYIAASGDGIDKVNAAIRDALKSNPLGGPAFGSFTDFSGHRDELARTDGRYK